MSKDNMQNEIDVSVVVPVYNAEKTIDRCVESLLAQQTQYPYEVLLINDGSKDSSLNLLRRWQTRDPRIRVFTQANSGVSAARNCGISEARGRYVVFVDSDDWCGPLYIEHLRASVVEGRHGVTFAGHIEETGTASVTKHQQEAMYSPADYHAMLDARRIYNQGIPWGEIYDLVTIRGGYVKFPEKVQFGEDLIFLLQYLLYADYVRFIDVADYHYSRQNNGSLIGSYHSFESESKGYRQFRDVLAALKEKFGISEEELWATNGWLLHFAMRAVKTIYRPGRNHLPRSERLSKLQDGFTDADRMFMAGFIDKRKGVDRWICRCMKSGSYRLLDWSLNLFFRLRYSVAGRRLTSVILRKRKSPS